MTGAGPRRGSSRDLVLDRVREALRGRTAMDHPGALSSVGPTGGDGFAERLTLNGGRVVPGPEAAPPGAWLTRALPGLLAPLPPELEDHGREPTLAVGSEVPASLTPELPQAPAHEALVGLSLARAGAADTGSVLLPSDGGRAVQLLPPVHVVWLHRSRIHPRLEDALVEAGRSLPRALGIHSGPSKSADIGRTVVQGVHGPGRLIVILLEDA